MENIRNFSIIAHIDHGKSTLADRFLELTGTVPKEKMKEQFLDSMDLERERGITIKMQPVRMNYKGHVLNLIDTPGHVDFSYEVSRSLQAVEGAVLLVDATKGVQAQTISNLNLAKGHGLKIIPVINKIDSANAKTEEAADQLIELLGIKKEEILFISAKLGIGVEVLLDRIIKDIPCPKGDVKKPFQALIFDSEYDSYKGVIAFVRVVEGQIKEGDDIFMIQAVAEGKVKELGFFLPQLNSQKELKAGDIGYIATGVKEIEKVRVGETITHKSVSKEVKALPGYKEPKPVVFASIYPQSADDYDLLKDGLGKLKLSDASLFFEPEYKEALGRGFRTGFLGSLHLEIIMERLKREFQLGLIVSSPAVVYRVVDKRDKEEYIYSATDWPEQTNIQKALEPWVFLEILFPTAYLGRVLEIAEGLRGRYVETEYLTKDSVKVIYEVPLQTIIVDFYDRLKSASQGYGSMNYEFLGYKEADLVKLDILVAGVREEAFSKVVISQEAEAEGRRIVKKLKETLPAQMFSVPLQAVVSGKIVARETISAKRKDVIAPLYGGDYTRKRKLLEIQKKGKRELKAKGKVSIPPNVFLEIFRSG